MGWETRGSRQYMYQSFRDRNGQVRRRYLGRGSAAIRAAAQQQQLEEQAAADAKVVVKAQSQQAALEQALGELDGGIALLLEAELLASGYHKHLGTWRKRRAIR